MATFHSPLAMSSVGPSESLSYNDLTENFLELVRDQETASDSEFTVTPDSVRHIPSQDARSIAERGRKKERAGGEERNASAARISVLVASR